jgi:hypothetical protein
MHGLTITLIAVATWALAGTPKGAAAPPDDSALRRVVAGRADQVLDLTPWSFEGWAHFGGGGSKVEFVRYERNGNGAGIVWSVADGLSSPALLFGDARFRLQPPIGRLIYSWADADERTMWIGTRDEEGTSGQMQVQREQYNSLREDRRSSRLSPLAFMEGYLPGCVDSVGRMLASDRPARCEAVEAAGDTLRAVWATPDGRLTLTLSPRMGHAPTKIRLERGPTDQYAGAPLWSVLGGKDRTVTQDITVDLGDHTRVGTVWFARRGTMTVITRRSGQPEQTLTVRGERTVSADAPRSPIVWDRSAIAVGTPALVFRTPDGKPSPIQYAWDGSKLREFAPAEALAAGAAAAAPGGAGAIDRVTGRRAAWLLPLAIVVAIGSVALWVRRSRQRASS